MTTRESSDIELTPAQVHDAFRSSGVTFTDWAAANGVSSSLICDLLRGRTKGFRGKAHRCAVLLGLKKGVAEQPVATFDPRNFYINNPEK